MKKLITLILFAVFAINASSQVSWNVKAGVGIESPTINDPYDKYTSETGLAFKIGIGLEKTLSLNWGFMPTLEIVSKHFSGDGTYDMFGAQIPLDFSYRIGLGGMNLLLKAGPYVGFITGDSDPSFDAGINAGVNFEYRRLIFGLEYEKGFTEIESTYKNQALFLVCGYKL